MVFSSYEFVFAFLPVAVLGYFFFDGFLCHRVGPVFLLSASYVFYAWGETRYLMNGGSFIDAIDLPTRTTFPSADIRISKISSIGTRCTFCPMLGQRS